ncbi:MAG: hypothetical protein KDE53_19335 [Caldilineaceae bacterium]|nr:hypothetical protein [Caldilineaceae bacterium]MCB0121869.1 hypothetical protein [Caldilineaceae bacterium]MCB0183695.1 hypothetical protein [Caldilineaceae bacterium]
MSPEQPSSTYQTYLLRLRRRSSAEVDATPNDHAVENEATSACAAVDWQLILIHPYTGARRTFDSPEALTLFLQEELNGR